ncbi:MAG TPA: beta-L-arabinofuranosidase domain-containing protein [Armatimonadota bacterium]|jgi:hypothetical protein
MKANPCIVGIFLAAGPALGAGAAEQGGWAVKPVVASSQQLFPQGSVRLLDGPFKNMQDTDHAYLIRLEPDRLLAQFRVESGLEPRAKPYGGWESPAQPGVIRSLAGHSLGHYLSAASLMYRMTDDYRLKERVAYITKELKECQDKRGDGSLVAFPYMRELEADIRAGKVETIDKYWAPFYTIHKDMAGLRDAWLYCGDATARDILAKLADWCGSMVKGLPDERRERLLNNEHGGMAEVLADVYAITGESRYIDYARLYSHHAVMDPLADGKDTLTGLHANTQIPKFIGFQRIHELAGDARPGAAADFFWKTVVKDRSWVNGGNSIYEHFPEPKTMGDEITGEGGPETCNTYNMLKLTAALFREKPGSAYVDYYENALFNHILASEAPLVGAGAFVYYTPLRPDFARSYGSDFNSFWCCTGTGMENHARYGEFIYSHDDRALTVNLFIASTLKWPERGLALRQETRFPEEAGTTLVVTEAPADAIALRIRHPSWLAAEKMSVRVNGKPTPAASTTGGYAQVARAWKPGDRIEIQLPMKVRVVRQPNCDGWVSLFYGPILLAGELGSEGMSQSDYVGPYTPTNAMLPIARAPMFVASADSDLLAGLAPIPGRPAAFRTSGIVKPADVTLAPFYSVHFQRYAIYWRLSTTAQAQEQARVLAEAKRQARELDARTLDRVRVGEQQPETDHNLLFDRSRSGGGPEGRHRRSAAPGGWFSFEMKAPPAGKKAAVLLTYWGQEDGREFDLLVQGAVIASPKVQGGKDGYYSVEYPIPDSLASSRAKLTVRIQAKADQPSAAINDLRIVNVE